jgi:hypothetical protein
MMIDLEYGDLDLILTALAGLSAQRELLAAAGAAPGALDALIVSLVNQLQAAYQDSPTPGGA